MSQISETLMSKLYGRNIWDGFVPLEVDPVVQGWNGNHPSLAKLAPDFAEHIIVDVGVWKGQSTIMMANNLREKNINGVIIAVDTFLGSPEHWDNKDELFARKNGMPNLYQIFMSNVFAHDLANYVIPLPQTSTTACAILKAHHISPTLVHVDAAHEYREALTDISDYWSILADGGVLIGDDYHETWPGIVKAAGEFSASVSRPLTIELPKFIISKSAK